MKTLELIMVNTMVFNEFWCYQRVPRAWGYDAGFDRTWTGGAGYHESRWVTS
jgi:hypothetical protein